ncbi:MAG: hypothetical protein ABI972_31370 [Acidobacteriota bacterium]
MPFAVTKAGEAFGARADRLGLALCGDGLNMVAVVRSAGGHVHYQLWDILPGSGFSEIAIEPPADTGIDVVACAVTEDRLLMARNSGGTYQFRAFTKEFWFHATNDVATGYDSIELALAGLPPPDHPLHPPAVTMALKGGGARPLQQRVPSRKIVVKIGPKVCRAVSAEVTSSHKLRTCVWTMDWGGQIPTKLGKTTLTTSTPAFVVDVAATRSDWDEDHFGTSEWVAAFTAASPVGALKLRRFRRAVPAETPAISSIGNATAAEAVKGLAVCTVGTGAGAGVVTAVIDETGHLKVIGWKLEAGGGITRWMDAAAAETGTVVACAWMGGPNVVTAIRQDDKVVKLIYWRFADDGSAAPVRLGEKIIHATGFQLRVQHRPGSGSNLGDTIVGVNLESGDLKLIRYKVTA